MSISTTPSSPSDSPPPRSAAVARLLRSLKITGATVLLLAASIGGWWGLVQYNDNFHAVAEGVLYRSAQPDKGDLAAAVQTHGIKSVLNLRGAHAGQSWYDDEVAASRELGLTHYDFGLSAKRFVTAEQITDIMAIVRNAPKPLLIHCRSGADRTGLVAALYRYTEAHASAADADGQLSLAYGHFPYLTSKSVAMDHSYWAFVYGTDRAAEK